ncbi:uncharacterized protein BDV17DRAFT_285315 [Aspergillus undulatus]|uniref:uncharacterized protein n=1 Tax=Aspergillus undulatus TaxID=1810928 RepID=UPI003CCD03A0
MASKELRDNVSRWQYNLISRGWTSCFIQKFGGTAIQSLLSLSAASLGRLGPYYGLIIHMAIISEQQMDPGSASQTTAIQSLASNSFIALGTTAYVIGLTTELVSEFQRKAFKANPANKGKPYSGGLFLLATNISYGAYTAQRAGYALACGGLV